MQKNPMQLLEAGTMYAELRRQPFGIILGLLMIAGSASWTQSGEPDSTKGRTASESLGGMISIPGSPLPPMSEASVRDAIALYTPIVTGLRIFGKTLALARGLGFLATLHSMVGEDAKAEHLLNEALEILYKIGAKGRELVFVHNELGLVLLSQRRYAEAARSLRAAVNAATPETLELLELRAIALQNLASVEHRLGDVERSESAYLDALEVLRHLRKEREPRFQLTLGNLAILYQSIGDLAAARKIQEELLDQGALSPALRLVTLNNLAATLRKMRDFRMAAERFEQALPLTVEGSREHAIVLMNLAAAHEAAGELEKATNEGERALQFAERLDEEGASFAAAVKATLGMVAFARGDLIRAESLVSLARNSLVRGKGDSEDLAELTHIQALIAHRRGHRERALVLSRQALDLDKRNLDRILAFGSEAQRLAYRSNSFPYDQLADLGDGDLLAEAVLATKGAVLESLLAERALVRKSKSPADRERLDRIHALKLELMEKVGRGDTQIDKLELALKQEETALAKNVSQAVAPERLRAGLAQVQAALESDQVLIEIILFQRREVGGKLVLWYGGVVIPQQGRPAWVPLGRAERLEDSIESLVGKLDSGNRGVERISTLGDVTRTLRELHDRLWKPLAKVSPAGARRVLLSPDGVLSFVPWAMLLNEDEMFLAESWQFTQLGSGRDLLRITSISAEKTLLALADGKEDLPFARQEVESLAHRAAAQGWRPTVLLGEQASEAELSQRPSPRILHFATHGGTLQGDWAQAIGDRLSKRPMYRGFLWLGGASKTLEAWKRGRILPFSDDGILTAEEVGGLDLSGTWLTVLSACQSGTGDARSGEGVLGLRRGFALAGTENLLFTLWSVDDESTARFMETFYDRLFQTMDLHRAFQEVQVAELLRWKQDRGIPVAVFRAGAFVLTH